MIHTDRLVLRAPVDADRDAIAAIASQAVMRRLGKRQPVEGSPTAPSRARSPATGETEASLNRTAEGSIARPLGIG
ncbi:hypothetical protein [Caulobacter sp. LjRoot300]|uniref:hypothetical protein n=1 Tax=Caulobacter sp. LjRoot300 TaxID=3342321 RepID=UPI003ED0283B